MTDAATREAPLPCPFCGSTKITVYEGDAYQASFIRCDPCDMSPDGCWDVPMDEALRFWNTRATLPPDASEMVEKVARAIGVAECRGREGPFGGYDYGHNTDFYGPAPEGGRYVIRDFRDPSSPDWGKWIHQTNDHDEHERIFVQMTQHHIARAAITAIDGGEA